MAYVLSGNVKKFIKVSALSPTNESITRTYSGLNIDTTGTPGGAVNGASISNATEFFSIAYSAMTNNSWREAYYGTEEIINTQA